jgi:hypothetical protein
MNLLIAQIASLWIAAVMLIYTFEQVRSGK